MLLTVVQHIGLLFQTLGHYTVKCFGTKVTTGAAAADDYDDDDDTGAGAVRKSRGFCEVQQVLAV